MSRAAHVTVGTSIAMVTTSLIWLTPSASGAAACELTRLSVSSSGEQANKESGRFGGAMTADGRFVVFASGATNLVAGDTNGDSDVFIRDQLTDETRRVSVGPGGVQGNRSSSGPAISADGRYIAFISDATNLVDDDTNGEPDVFVWDEETESTVRASIGRDGAEANGDSRYRPAISRDGRYVMFKSSATNMVPGDTNDSYDVFIRDMIEETTKLASVAPDGSPANGDTGEPTVSPNGRYVAFQSKASNLVPDDTNGSFDVFVWDQKRKRTRLISAGSDGNPAAGSSYNPAISVKGRYVAFASDAPNIVEGDDNGKMDVFVQDKSTGSMSLVSVGPGGVQGNKFSGQASMSANGRYISFSSDASNLVDGDTNRSMDVFVRDQETGTIELVSLGHDELPANENSYRPWISANGREISFASLATNLVVGDTNDEGDMFACTLR